MNTKLIITATAILTTMSLSVPTIAEEGATKHDHGHEMHKMQQAHIEAQATLNTIDLEARTVNVSHEPIPSLGWPAMTMNMATADTLDLEAFESGASVTIHLAKADDGIYTVVMIVANPGANPVAN